MSEIPYACDHADGRVHALRPSDNCVRAAEEVNVTSFGDPVPRFLLGREALFLAGHQPIGWRVTGGPAPLRDLIR